MFPLVTRGRPQQVSTSDRPELWSGVRLLARLGQQGNVVVCGTLDVSPIIDEI